MQPTGLVFIAGFAICALPLRSADATTTIDYSQRNTPFAPGVATPVVPEKQLPKSKENETVQEKRFDTTTVDRKTSVLGERRAAIDVKEARDKNVVEKNSHRPEMKEQPTSTFNHRSAAISTSNDTTKPPTVTKYQDGLTSASATNMARFPAVDRATNAKINRFVFQKNPAEPTVASDSRTITPAAGGSDIRK